MKPTNVVRFIVDRHHVNDSYELVAADIAERAKAATITDPRLRARAITQALIRHRQNRRLYTEVMG